MIDAKKITANDVLKILETVTDPEIPVLSIVDLGIIRKIEIYNSLEKPPSPQDAEGGVRVFITPTYSGCPAMDVIQINIRMALLEHGFNNVEIKTVLSPPWTTEWMSEAGKQKLKAYGIAPPNVMQQVCTPGRFSKRRSRSVPALQFISNRNCQSLWLYSVQSFISMRRLQGTLRLL
jgi:ring-1,2-phenylacetyl-CoA epoxidase subunit PaaD